MFRKLIPLAVAIVLVLGCGKKPKDGGDGGGDKTDSDPNASYTMKLRAAQQGDKVDVTESESMTNEVTKDGKSETSTRKKRAEYTEHILEMPAGADHPTKLTRAYKVAERTDYKTKDVKALSYQGKTVTIEKDAKKGSGPGFGRYKIAVDGKQLDFAEAFEIENEFRDDRKGNELEGLLPKQAVKVGESWTVEPEALKGLTGGMGPGLDKSKSKFTCKLTRAYTTDGKQWGTLSFDFDMVVDVTAASKGKETGSGTAKISGTLDSVIDGSARDMTIKGTMKASFTATDKGGPAKGSVDGTFEHSVKTVK
jgi:hypothetical protein